VISGGLNVYPPEVEAVLDALPGVAESAVVGLPDDDLGERVVAVVVAEPGAVLDPEAVRRAARAHLAGHKAPKQVVVVSELPRNTLGKARRPAARRPLTAWRCRGRPGWSGRMPQTGAGPLDV
jgi:malonyl-CoA/methylmalonyl-CoA synthetase